MATDAEEGVTVMEFSTIALTVPEAVPLIDPSVAVIVDEPGDTPAAKPLALTLTKLMGFEVHATWAVTSCVVPSLYTPWAESCFVCPEATEKVEGITLIEVRVGEPPPPVPPPPVPPPPPPVPPPPPPVPPPLAAATTNDIVPWTV